MSRPTRLTFWRRRAVAGVAIAALGAIVWAALADGSGDGTAASRLSTKKLVGERLVAGLRACSPAALEHMIDGGGVAGVLLFSEDLGTRAHARRLIHRLQATPRPPGLDDPLLVMTDQEGGVVKRLAGPPDASALEMGRRGARYSRRQGSRTAASLRAVGVNVDLAPVLDVGRAGSAIRAEQRAFGASPGRVARTAIPFAAAMQVRGVAATGKHFPGVGAAPQSTDVAVQRIGLSRGELRRVDQRPYGAFVAAHGDLVMLSTAVYPRLSSRPAAFSRRVATGELRDRLHFEGVSISDALGTVAARDFGGPARTGRAAARAGTDLLLYESCRAAARAGRALTRGLRSGELDRDRFEESAQRVLDLRGRVAGA